MHQTWPRTGRNFSASSGRKENAQKVRVVLLHMAITKHGGSEFQEKQPTVVVCWAFFECGAKEGLMGRYD